MPIGPQGPRGSAWRVGTGAPSTISSDMLNDQYFQGSTGHIWLFNGNAWVDTGVTISGISGTAGAAGTNGTNGAAGTNGTNGTNGLGYNATSMTSLLVAIGGLNLVSQAQLAYTAGARVRFTSAGSPSVYMEGLVTAYTVSTGAMAVTIDNIFGNAGTKNDWNINLAGQPGINGLSITGTGYLATVPSTNIDISAAAIPSSISVTTQAGLAYLTGNRIRITATAGNYIEGVVYSYSGTTLSFNADRKAGVGAFSNWTIGIAGDVGLTSFSIINSSSNASYTPANPSFENVPSLSYTTPNDGVTRSYVLMFKTEFRASAGAGTSSAIFQFFNQTDSLIYDKTDIGKADTTTASNIFNASLLDYQIIGPGKTIVVQASAGSASFPGSAAYLKFILLSK